MAFEIFTDFTDKGFNFYKTMYEALTKPQRLTPSLMWYKCPY